MTIVVEDGTVVAGANSYITRASAIAYAAARGVTLANTDATDAQIVQAFDYLESMRSQFKGELVEYDQPAAWPRAGATIEGYDWSSDEIPRQVIAAQCALVVEINAGEDPFNPTAVVGPVIEKTVPGAVTVKYASATSSKVSKASSARTIINLLLKRSGLLAVRA